LCPDRFHSPVPAVIVLSFRGPFPLRAMADLQPSSVAPSLFLVLTYTSHFPLFPAFACHFWWDQSFFFLRLSNCSKLAIPEGGSSMVFGQAPFSQCLVHFVVAVIENSFRLSLVLWRTSSGFFAGFYHVLYRDFPPFTSSGLLLFSLQLSPTEFRQDLGKLRILSACIPYVSSYKALLRCHV